MSRRDAVKYSGAGHPVKKAWSQTVAQVIKEYPLAGVENVCRLFGVSRSAFYKKEKLNNKRCLQQALVLEEVRKIRKEQPKLGTEKVHILIKPFLLEHGIKMGRVGPTGINCIPFYGLIICYQKERKKLLVRLNPSISTINIPTW